MTEHGTSPTSHGTSGGTQDRAGPGPWSQEPRTVTGRRLFTDNDPMDMLESDGVTWGDVVAIEREAAAPLPQIDVERLYDAMTWLDNDDPGAFNIVAISEPDTRPVAAALADRYARLSPPPVAAVAEDPGHRTAVRILINHAIAYHACHDHGFREYLEAASIADADRAAGDRDPGTATVFRVIRERFGYGTDADDLIRALLPGLTPPGDRDPAVTELREALVGVLGCWNIRVNADEVDTAILDAARDALRRTAAPPGDRK